MRQYPVDVYSLLSLPQLYPNVKHITCIDDSDYEEILNVKSTPPEKIYAPQFAKWADLETLYISIYRTHIPAMIIGLSVFNYLTNLDISFQKFSNANGFIIKPLFEFISNLPALKVLTLAYVSIDLEDMEKLHKSAPDLKELGLLSVELMESPSALIDAGDGSILLTAGGELFVQATASKLKDISIVLKEGVKYNDDLTNILTRWIVCFGQKYPSIETLTMNIKDTYIANNRLEDSLAKAVAHMPNLKYYRMGLSDVTSNILKVMDTNDIELNDLEFTCNGRTRFDFSA